MPLFSRNAMLLIVGILTLSCSACKSNNEGKIVGKWLVTGATGESETGFKQMEKEKLGLFFEFKADGTITMTAESTDQTSHGKQQQIPYFTFTFKYKLKCGDSVEFYDLPKDLQQKNGGGMFGSQDRGRERIKISGDNMTIFEDKVTLSLFRVK